MKEFSNIFELFAYAKERNPNITLGWPKVTPETLDYKKGCKIEHSDGSYFFVTNVLLEEVKFTIGSRMDSKKIKKPKKESEPAYIIYSEHHNPLVYLKSDLLRKPKILKRNKKGEFK